MAKYYGCPACAATVQRGDPVCAKCGHDLTAPLATSVAVLAGPPAQLSAVSIDQRRSILQVALTQCFTPDARVESQTDTQFVIVYGRRPNHLLHFLVGLFTLGLWWFVWLIIAIGTREVRRIVTVDEYGRLTTKDF